MRGSKIIQLFEDTVKKTDPNLMDKIQVMAANSQMRIHDLHSRTIACHCECMGMMSENMLMASRGSTGIYGDGDFLNTMIKWEIVDKENKSLI